MIDDKTTYKPDASWGDRAVSGMLYGLVGGVLMGAILMLGDLTSGHTLVQALNLFNPFGQQAILTGWLLHFGISAVYGALFGILLPIVPKRAPGWLAGLVYGTLLFALAKNVLLAQADFGMAVLAPLTLWLGHAAYGLALGFLRPRG